MTPASSSTAPTRSSPLWEDDWQTPWLALDVVIEAQVELVAIHDEPLAFQFMVVVICSERHAMDATLFLGLPFPARGRLE